MLQPGQAIPLENIYPLVVVTESDDSHRHYCLSVAGHQLTGFPSLLENVDMVYKLFWVFNMKYTPSAALLFKFFEFAVFKQHTGRVASCVAELSGVLQNIAADGQ